MRTRGLLVGVVAALFACGSDGGDTMGSVVVVTELPVAGVPKAASENAQNAVAMFFEEKMNRACGGTWTVSYDKRNHGNDAGWNGDLARANATANVADNRIVAVIGTFNSGAAAAMLPIYNPANLVMVSHANTYPGLTKPGTGEGDEPGKYYPSGRRTYARMIAADDVQGSVAARWAKTLGVTTVYILDDGELYGKGVAAVFENEATSVEGVTVVGRETYDLQASSYAGLGAKMVAMGPSLVYIAGTDTRGGALAKDLRAAGYTGILLAPDGLVSEAFLNEAGTAGEGFYATLAGVIPSQYAGAAATWRDAYKAKYSVDPEVYSIFAYAAAEVIFAAFDRVCASGGSLTDREAVRAAVLGTNNVPTVLGNTTFDANGDTNLVVISGLRVVSGMWQFQTAL